jgi:hypothetical protein
MPSNARLLLVARKTWLPPFRHGKLLVGSAPAADIRLDGLEPFHAVIEERPQGALVHDLVRRGDVRDGMGRPCPPQGALIGPGERFSIGTHALAVVADDETVHESSGPACTVCGTGSELVSGQGRVVGGLFVCLGCLGVVDEDPFSFPGHELVARLGSGGMATVYLALIRGTDELRALKVFARESGASRFIREARLLLELSHPNIVRVLDAGSTRGILYLACELVTGGDALARLARTGPVASPDAARIGADVAAALAFAHGRGVVHRDVKPSNVLLARDGTAKLSDFGLAKELGETARTTGTGTALGTIAYAAPEQLEDARRAGPGADVFGLAATLFHLATGTPLRRAGSLDPSDAAPSLNELGRLLEPRLAAFIVRALARDPMDRPTASEAEKALRPLARR